MIPNSLDTSLMRFGIFIFIISILRLLMTIGLDMMGGDFAPLEAVNGVLQYL